MTATGLKWRSQRWNETERKQAPPLLKSTKVNAKYLKECTAPIENGGLKENQRSIHPLIDCGCFFYVIVKILDEQYNPFML
ncbi:proteasome-associated protein ECM29-like protein isoform X1 [Iris pallida]|uniref:Proteasome-associated protein ECM29-like protein isoform X1 n=1 Tax=Iris pallida TaxID=29817 RepID=A0AAX6DR66_IRIPA|nr:proteasome-associated protein ECM29-like protein isoform X1 [Iris pallida]